MRAEYEKMVKLGFFGIFLDNHLNQFLFWKKNIYRFIIFSFSSLIFFTLIFSIITNYPTIKLIKLLCIIAPIYGIGATIATKQY